MRPAEWRPARWWLSRAPGAVRQRCVDAALTRALVGTVVLGLRSAWAAEVAWLRCPAARLGSLRAGLRCQVQHPLYHP